MMLPDQFILDYATPKVVTGNPFIRPMRRWRAICGYCFWATVGGLFIWVPLGLIAAAAALAAATITLIYMGCAAQTEVNTKYAARHVVLAIALSFVCLLGIWLVPILVESDLTKWRAVDERNRTSG